jgi:hypothetical protein
MTDYLLVIVILFIAAFLAVILKIIPAISSFINFFIKFLISTALLLIIVWTVKLGPESFGSYFSGTTMFYELGTNYIRALFNSTLEAIQKDL